MNIFVLSTSPEEAAELHCDQHLHKMILESAQLLSTALYFQQPDTYRSLLSAKAVYAVTHPAHPCTKWTSQSPDNMHWVIRLALQLNRIRLRTGSITGHASCNIIRAIESYIPPASSPPQNFVFAGPPHIALKTCPITQKYQEYYKYKLKTWGGMTYKRRQTPQFLESML